MKTFIFIFILVIGFFFYLFIDSDTAIIKQTAESQSHNLEDIEQQNSFALAKEVNEKSMLSNEAPSAIPEDQTFEMVKNILKEASGKDYLTKITLNTKIDSYLNSTQAKEKFKRDICSCFKLTCDDIEKKFKENRLVWDWVNQLKE